MGPGGGGGGGGGDLGGPHFHMTPVAKRVRLCNRAEHKYKKTQNGRKSFLNFIQNGCYSPLSVSLAGPLSLQETASPEPAHASAPRSYFELDQNHFAHRASYLMMSHLQTEKRKGFHFLALDLNVILTVTLSPITIWL